MSSAEPRTEGVSPLARHLPKNNRHCNLLSLAVTFYRLRRLDSDSDSWTAPSFLERYSQQKRNSNKKIVTTGGLNDIPAQTPARAQTQTQTQSQSQSQTSTQTQTPTQTQAQQGSSLRTKQFTHAAISAGHYNNIVYSICGISAGRSKW